MMLPLGLCALWLIAANVIAMFPSKDYHWRAAYGLIAIGVPLLGWVTWEMGPIVGMVILAAGASDRDPSGGGGGECAGGRACRLGDIAPLWPGAGDGGAGPGAAGGRVHGLAVDQRKRP